MRSLSSNDILLVRIPPGSLPFRAQETYLSYTTSATYHQIHELGLSIWLNRECIEKYPPPKDVEQLYYHWIFRSCGNPSRVEVFLESFREAFPDPLRSSHPCLAVFSVSERPAPDLKKLLSLLNWHMLQPLREAEKGFEFLEIELRTKGRRNEDIGFERWLSSSSAINF